MGLRFPIALTSLGVTVLSGRAVLANIPSEFVVECAGVTVLAAGLLHLILVRAGSAFATQILLLVNIFASLTTSDEHLREKMSNTKVQQKKSKRKFGRRKVKEKGEQKKSE